jgi:hypothetical protein
MVKGQLRALGTPQHLKQKFGSGYEIIIKLGPTEEEMSEAKAPTIAAGGGGGGGGGGGRGGGGDDFGLLGGNDEEDVEVDAISEAGQGETEEEARAARVVRFVRNVFPAAGVLSANGGLLTLQVPAGSMDVGKAFAALEGGKRRLGIADYAVAQPTLEQVFVRTVLEHSGDERPGFASPSSGGAGAAAGGAEPPQQLLKKRSTSLQHPDADVLSRGSLGDGVSSHQDLAGLGAAGAGAGAGAAMMPQDPMSLETGVATKWLGLDRRSHKFMAIACGITAYICYNFVLRGRIGYVFLPFLVTFVASVIGCAGCCCCIPSAGEEEDD